MATFVPPQLSTVAPVSAGPEPKPIPEFLRETVRLLQPSGKFLDFSFQDGDLIPLYNSPSITSYTTFEHRPQMWEIAQSERFHLPVSGVQPIIHRGRWQDVLLLAQPAAPYDTVLLHSVEFGQLSAVLFTLLTDFTTVGSRIASYAPYDWFETHKDTIAAIPGLNVQRKEHIITGNNSCTRVYILLFTVQSELSRPVLEQQLFLKSNADALRLEQQITTQMERQRQALALSEDVKKRSPKCGVIVIDNFYNNAHQVREFALKQEFSVKGNYPGQRTVSYATEDIKAAIQNYVQVFGGKITDFPIPRSHADGERVYNGSFQYTTSRDRSWVHVDGYNNWAAVVYLTPDAPLTSGTGFYRFHDGVGCERDQQFITNKAETDKYSQDMTKWELVDRVGNVFNRLVMFDSTRYHMSMDYFGDCKENGRLFQLFFFSTEC